MGVNLENLQNWPRSEHLNEEAAKVGSKALSHTMSRFDTIQSGYEVLLLIHNQMITS